MPSGVYPRSAEHNAHLASAIRGQKRSPETRLEQLPEVDAVIIFWEHELIGMRLEAVDA